MKKVVLIGLLATMFGCISAAPDEMQERLTLKTKDGQELSISKEVISRFSGLIRDYLAFPEFGSLMSFESDIVKPEALEALLSLLEQVSSVLIEKPISKNGSYRQLADVIIERDLSRDTLLNLIVLLDFFEVNDERIKQACAFAVANQMEKDGLTCDEICRSLSDDLLSPNILPYIAQQYYLMNDAVPKVFEGHVKEIGITVRDLVIHEKSLPIEKGVLNLSGRYIKDLEGIGDIPGIDKVDMLGLYQNQLESIKGLESLNNLKWLYFQNDEMKYIEGLDTCHGLSFLYLNNDQIKAIESPDLPHLADFHFNNQIETLFARVISAGAAFAGVASLLLLE